MLAFVAADAPPALTVSAAISLTDALESLQPLFVRHGLPGVRINYGSSNMLARQIVRGAPVDVFISADEAQMQVAETAGAIAPGTRVNLLGNRLAIVTRLSASSTAADAQALTRNDIRRIAIGDPNGVPAGVYAREYLRRVGLWERLQSKLVPTQNVRVAVAAVENGAADAAIVYESDVSSSRRLKVGFIVNGADAPRIVYPAAIAARSRRRDDGVRLLKFLCGPEAARVFEQHRFIALGCW